jgi:hypothetical protein
MKNAWLSSERPLVHSNTTAQRISAGITVAAVNSSWDSGLIMASK